MKDQVDKESEKLFYMNTHEEMGRYVISEKIRARIDELKEIMKDWQMTVELQGIFEDRIKNFKKQLKELNSK